MAVGRRSSTTTTTAAAASPAAVASSSSTVTTSSPHHQRHFRTAAAIGYSGPSANATSALRLAVLLVVLLSLLEVTAGQNIHFSNGWYPGKKRSAPSAAAASSLSGAASAAGHLEQQQSEAAAAAAAVAAAVNGRFPPSCTVRSELGEIIYKLIVDELFRLPSSCVYPASRGLRDLLVSTAGKLDKW